MTIIKRKSSTNKDKKKQPKGCDQSSVKANADDEMIKTGEALNK